MKFFWPVVIALLACGPLQAIEVIDDAGRSVRLSAPAQRIVSLAPHITELLFAAGAGDRVVGVSQFSDYPPEAAALPQVGGGAGLDLEAIIGLRPDLVVAWQSGNSAGQLQQLERLGLTLFYSEPGMIDSIAVNLERLGRLSGTQTRAATAARAFRDAVKALRSRYSGREPVTVFYQVWEHPLMTVNGEQIISDWIRLCGGVNLFEHLAELAPVIDLEAVLQADPQVLIAGRYQGSNDGWRRQWLRWPQLRAVANGHLYTVPAEMIARQTPRALPAVEELCGHLEMARQQNP
ncbi:MAG: cobalamin-binding protein [Thiogranum sp.]|nr:cobalamin-binding protein [Thiogranum sp.]